MSTFQDKGGRTGCAGWRRACARLLAAGLIGASLGAGAQALRSWIPLAKDNAHDPASPALKLLQEPREALSRLPPGSGGNQVDWVEAIEKNRINPRTNVLPQTEVRLRDTDVLLNLRGGQPIVRFPHRAHTLWLDCKNCHDHLFKSVAGATKLSKLLILQGEQCGVCHGAVAFPLTECKRCHSVPRTSPARSKLP